MTNFGDDDDDTKKENQKRKKNFIVFTLRKENFTTMNVSLTSLNIEDVDGRCLSLECSRPDECGSPSGQSSFAMTPSRRLLLSKLSLSIP